MCIEIDEQKKNVCKNSKLQIFLTGWADPILKNKDFENDIRVMLSR